MIRYILMTIGSIGYFIYLILINKVSAGQIIPRPEYIKLTAPILIGISAGLFFLSRLRIAGIIALIGLSITSRDILGNWFFIKEFLHSKYIIQYFVFVALTTFLLFLLGFIAVRAILYPNKVDRFEIMNYSPKGLIAKIVGFIPAVIIVLMTFIWIILMNIK